METAPRLNKDTIEGSRRRVEAKAEVGEDISTNLQGFVDKVDLSEQDKIRIQDGLQQIKALFKGIRSEL